MQYTVWHLQYCLNSSKIQNLAIKCLIRVDPDLKSASFWVLLDKVWSILYGYTVVNQLRYGITGWIGSVADRQTVDIILKKIPFGMADLFLEKREPNFIYVYDRTTVNDRSSEWSWFWANFRLSMTSIHYRIWHCQFSKNLKRRSIKTTVVDFVPNSWVVQY